MSHSASKKRAQRSIIITRAHLRFAHTRGLIALPALAMIKLRPSASPEAEDGCARSSPHVVQPRIAVTAAKRGRLRWLLSQRTVLLCPLAVLTVLLLLDMARR